MQESEAKFRSLISEAPFPTAVYLGESFIIDVANDEMIRLWGKTPEVIGQPLINALPELDGQVFISLLEEVRRTGIAYNAKGQPADLVVDGYLQRFWFNFIYKPLLDEAGRVYAILNMAVDVSAQVKSQEQLEESNLFARSIFENSPVAKAVYLGEEMIVDIVNQNMLKIMGRDQSIIGRSYLDILAEPERTQTAERLRRVYTTGETFSQPEEKIIVVRHGQPHIGYYSFTYKPLRNTTGEIYGIINTATEITDQVLARKKVEEAEIILLAAIDVAELGTWSINVENNKIIYSHRLQQWLGIEEGYLQPTGSSNIVEADRERVKQAIAQATEPGGKGEMDEIYTIVNLQTGQKRILHVNGKALYDETGKTVSLAGTAQDVTLEQELQLALENEVQLRTEELQVTNQNMVKVNDELLRSNEELAQFAYIASHDLQEPLRKIQVFASILTSNLEVPQSLVPTIKKIHDSTIRMVSLIRDLLDFSRLLKSDSLYEPVDLNEVIREVRNELDIAIDEKRALLYVEDLPVIKAVSFQMQQLFFNLVGNALKFSKTDVQPVIQIRCTEASLTTGGNEIDPGKMFHITVSDNGIGFSQEHAEQIFEVFKRLQGREKYSGTGIGLALCKRVVENHHGKIFGESKVGEGACFHIFLPGHHH